MDPEKWPMPIITLYVTKIDVEVDDRGCVYQKDPNVVDAVQVVDRTNEKRIECNEQVLRDGK